MADTGQDVIGIDIPELKNKMGEMDAHFSTLSNTLKRINDQWNTSVNILDKAIFGSYGEKILSTWNENAATFGDFYKNYENWSALVNTAIAKNIDLENDIFEKYRSTAGNLDGVKEARDHISSGGKGDVSPEAQEVINNGKTHYSMTTTDPDTGEKTKSYINEKEHLEIREHYDKDGDLIYREVVQYDEEGNDAISTKYYDSRGKEVSEPPKKNPYKPDKSDEKTEETASKDDSETTQETETNTDKEKTTETTSLSSTQQKNKDMLTQKGPAKVNVVTENNAYGGTTETFNTGDGYTVSVLKDSNGEVVCDGRYKQTSNGLPPLSSFGGSNYTPYSPFNGDPAIQWYDANYNVIPKMPVSAMNK